MNEETKELTIKDLDELLSKYFKTLEDLEKENQELKEQEQEQLQLQLQEEENKELTTQEFQNQLLSDIKTLQENTAITYHFSYVGLLLSGLILCYVLFYKFLKIFI